jgi:uridine kinase
MKFTADVTLLIEQLASFITAVEHPHPLRVAIDGIDAAGKTTLADALVSPISRLGRPVIRASVDRFHQPRATRYARGEMSPEGYYYDSFDYGAVRELLLRPLGPGGNRLYHTQIFDYQNNQSIPGQSQVAPPDAILLFDGVFLLRPELIDFWDVTIFVQIAPETAVARAIQRDSAAMGGVAQTVERYTRRYMPGQQLYLSACQPDKKADILIQNDDPAHPVLVNQPIINRTL